MTKNCLPFAKGVLFFANFRGLFLDAIYAKRIDVDHVQDGDASWHTDLSLNHKACVDILNRFKLN